MSPYWSKVSNITVALHGAASETITITGLYNSPTVTTNSSGSVSYSLPKGKFTLTGSVSGYTSDLQEVNSNTSDLYAMPIGKVLYWYGNECVDVTGGWIGCLKHGNSYQSKDTNALNLKCPTNDGCYYGSFGTINKISTTKYPTLNILAEKILGNCNDSVHAQLSNKQPASQSGSEWSYYNGESTNVMTAANATDNRFPLGYFGSTSLNDYPLDSYIVTTIIACSNTCKVYAIWLSIE